MILPRYEPRRRDEESLNVKEYLFRLVETLERGFSELEQENARLKKEIEKMKNSVVALRRLEYVNFLKNKKKYSTKKITFIQQYWRQYFYCYYLPCVMRIQRNIRLFIQRKNKKREFGISSSQLELYYQMRNKTSTGVQANIKREKC